MTTLTEFTLEAAGVGWQGADEWDIARARRARSS